MTEAAQPPPGTGGPPDAECLLAEPFDRQRVTGLRHVVATCAGAAGLDGDRLDDFVLAVNELLTNAVRHGGGAGRLRLWRDGSGVVCEVADTGRGLAPDQRRPDQRRPGDRPPLDTPGGWGLWLVQRLTDEVQVRTGADGTAVRIWSAVDRAEPDLPAGAG